MTETRGLYQWLEKGEEIPCNGRNWGDCKARRWIRKLMKKMNNQQKIRDKYDLDNHETTA